MELKRELDLPAGCEVISDEGGPRLKISIDPEVAYQALLEEFAERCGFDGEVDQYWLEVAYQCAKMDVQAAVLRAGGDFGFAIKVLNRPDYALRNWAAGRGIEAATQGKEARQHYKRLRGWIPGV